MKKILIFLGLLALAGCQHVIQLQSTGSISIPSEGCMQAGQLVAGEQTKMRSDFKDPNLTLKMEFCRMVPDDRQDSALAIVTAQHDGKKIEDGFAAMIRERDGQWFIAGVIPLYQDWPLKRPPDLAPEAVHNDDSAHSGQNR